MISLPDGILLFHGSYTAIPEIQISKCSPGLDFGKGFYLTTSFEQALSYIPSAVKKNIRRRRLPKDYNINDGCVSVYRFHVDPSLLVHCFQTADVDWLHFVASNRNDWLFQGYRAELERFDIIGGKIEDDSTAATLNSYISGDYGTTGTE